MISVVVAVLLLLHCKIRPESNEYTQCELKLNEGADAGDMDDIAFL